MQEFSSGYQHTGSNRRIDVNEVRFFESQLTYYDPKEVMVLKNELTLFNVFTTTFIEEYNKIYHYRLYDTTGVSKFISAEQGETQDIPFVDAAGKEFTSPIKDIACKIRFTQSDLLADAKTRTGIIAMLTNQALRSNMELMNKTGFYGNRALGLQGIFSNPWIVKVAGGAGAGNDWKNAGTTALQIYQSLLTLYNNIRTATNNVIKPDTMLLAPSLYNIIDSTPFSTNYAAGTIRQQFETAMQVKCIVAPELSGVELTANLGVASKDSLFMFKNTQEFITPLVNGWFNLGELIPHNLAWHSIAQSRFGGMIIRQPMSSTIYSNNT